eukprot:10342059-Prorocentrum_lima.AAC.1
MIKKLRHEACSGSLHDVAHVVSQDCLSDCLTKQPPNADKHPPSRELMQHRHRAYHTFVPWLVRN